MARLSPLDAGKWKRYHSMEALPAHCDSMPNDRKICLIDGPDENGTLTKAEAAVLALVDGGMSNHQIAARLSITVGTVKCHLHRVYEKLDVRSRTQAAIRWREHDHVGSTQDLFTAPKNNA